LKLGDASSAEVITSTRRLGLAPEANVDRDRLDVSSHDEPWKVEDRGEEPAIAVL